MDVVCRSLFPQLLERMKKSALKNAYGEINFYTAQGNMEEITPKMINELGRKGKDDIIVFVHDDIEFMSEGWDSKVIETMSDGFDILGVVGSTKYTGGLSFSAGREYSRGKYISDINGKQEYRVKVFSKHTKDEVKAIDGMFMAVTRNHFKKEQFDEKLTFFVENDFALRGKVGIVDILIGHYKTPELYGAHVWPTGQDIVKDSNKYFHNKWKLKDNKWGVKDNTEIDSRCASVEYETYQRLGQAECFKIFCDKYKLEVV